MNSKRALRWLLYALSVISFFASLFCVMWIFSSYSMAFSECAGTYDLFAVKPRCRQPAIAAILATCTFVASVVMPYIAKRKWLQS